MPFNDLKSKSFNKQGFLNKKNKENVHYWITCTCIHTMGLVLLHSYGTSCKEYKQCHLNPQTWGVRLSKNFLYIWYSFNVSSYLEISDLIAIIAAFTFLISATFSSLAFVSFSALLKAASKYTMINDFKYNIHIKQYLLWSTGLSPFVPKLCDTINITGTKPIWCEAVNFMLFCLFF